MSLGNVAYTKEQLLDILNYPGFPGDGLNPMARELVSAKLNIANGAGHECIDDAIYKRMPLSEISFQNRLATTRYRSERAGIY